MVYDPFMGNLRACFVVATLALAACGDDGGSAQQDAAVTVIDAAIDAKQFFDAPPPMYDTSCASNPAPTTATNNITIGGTVQRAALNGTTPQIVALDGAALEACDGTAANCAGQDSLGTDTSANGGSWSIGPIATGGTPLDAYVRMTATNSRPTLVYPASPFTADQPNVPVLTFDPALIDLLSFAGCDQDDQANGIIGVVVTDCADAPFTDSENVTITVTSGGTPVAGTSVVDVGSVAGAQAAGSFLVCNVPAAAAVTVGATYMGASTITMRAHDVRVIAGTTTTTLLRPGY